MSVEARAAVLADLDDLTTLFDGYRRFYGQAADLAGARAFVAERLSTGDSVILIAVDAAGRGLGFTQLYPSFSSVRMARIYVLNDLFVSEDGRGLGTGRLLLAAAEAFGRDAGAARLTLSTAETNAAAQALYESAGWTRDTGFRTYERAL
ncbi:MAG: GNAT family N-acetyltransferase [Caulobacteraceae bacterium]|nr:GNAT family N-acetyltransferase [Caulobacteraceae bacterium]